MSQETATPDGESPASTLAETGLGYKLNALTELRQLADEIDAAGKRPSIKVYREWMERVAAIRERLGERLDE